MATLQGIITRLNGSAGDWTFAQHNGMTVARQKVLKKAVPVRSLAQMLRRAAWANVINLYRAFSGDLHPSFENKPEGRSDFNQFMKYALGRTRVYLTKEQASRGGAVVAAYQLTRGTLETIEVALEEGSLRPYTNLYLGDLTISSLTTLQEFSQALIAHNSHWKDGDKLSVFYAQQRTDSEGVPRVTIQAVAVQLDVNDSTTTLAAAAGNLSGYFVTNDEGYLGGNRSVLGGIAYVHSRRGSFGKTLVSSQSFVLNNSALDTYTSYSARTRSIESYGGVNKDDFLTPNVVDPGAIGDNGSANSSGGTSGNSGNGGNGGSSGGNEGD